MNVLERAQAYIAAWNARDAEALLATFSPTGVYSDPATNGPLSGAAIAAYAQGLWSAFPDLAFEVHGAAEAGTDRAVLEWMMTGTNTGSFAGLPPTGRAVSIPGVDIIAADADGIAAVVGYFDSRLVPAQLGLQVLVQPDSVGPFSFGNAVTVQSGNKAKPGAFGITAIWNENSDLEEIRTLSRDTAREMLGMEGFIGATLVRVGGRGITLSAWERPENVKQIYGSDAHRKAMSRFWSDLSQAAFTSVWTPDHINPLWVRCTACKKMVDCEKSAGRCECGQALPEAPAYF